MVYKSILGAVGTCLAVASFNANANTLPVLESRLGGLAYYDPVADLTWMTDASPRKYITSGGQNMTWAEANTLVANLDVAGVTGWRLPDTLVPDSSCIPNNPPSSHGPGNELFGCTGSEMGNMFYNVLGGVAGTSISVTHNANYDLFTDIQDYRYWSATEYMYVDGQAYDGDKAYYFRFGSGGTSGQQDYGVLTSPYNVWAVHSGDVSLVPVPAAVWLFGSGLIGLVVVARRKA